jgi:hypothetical protein
MKDPGADTALREWRTTRGRSPNWTALVVAMEGAESVRRAW